MSWEATKAVVQHSKATGAALGVLHALAERVNQKRSERGEPWEAWPRKDLMAAGANCKPDHVKTCLRQLEAAGEIRWTGKTFGKGVRVYLITLPKPMDDDEYAEMVWKASRDQSPIPDQIPISDPEGGSVDTPKGGSVDTLGGACRPPEGVPVDPPEPEGEPEEEQETRNRTKTSITEDSVKSALAMIAGSVPRVPDVLPMLGKEQMTAMDFYDATAILDALNGLREQRAGERVKPWALRGPKGNLTPDGKVIVNRLWMSQEHDAGSLIGIAEKCFQGDPPWWRGEEPKSAAAVFAEKVFESATVYTPGDQWKEREFDEVGEPVF